MRSFCNRSQFFFFRANRDKCCYWKNLEMRYIEPCGAAMHDEAVNKCRNYERNETRENLLKSIHSSHADFTFDFPPLMSKNFFEKIIFVRNNVVSELSWFLLLSASFKNSRRTFDAMEFIGISPERLLSLIMAIVRFATYVERPLKRPPQKCH